LHKPLAPGKTDDAESKATVVEKIWGIVILVDERD